jgi:hypothetical protein
VSQRCCSRHHSYWPPTQITLMHTNPNAQDGYAVIAADGPGEYPVVGESRAGHMDAIQLTPGHVAYITTGASHGCARCGADAALLRQPRLRPRAGQRQRQLRTGRQRVLLHHGAPRCVPYCPCRRCTGAAGRGRCGAGRGHVPSGSGSSSSHGRQQRRRPRAAAAAAAGASQHSQGSQGGAGHPASGLRHRVSGGVAGR